MIGERLHGTHDMLLASWCQAHLSAVLLELWNRRQLALLEIAFPFGNPLLLLGLACLPCLRFFLTQVQLKAIHVQCSLCHYSC